MLLRGSLCWPSEPPGSAKIFSVSQADSLKLTKPLPLRLAACALKVAGVSIHGNGWSVRPSRSHSLNVSIKVVGTSFNPAGTACR
jgi:hypothetical protein